MSCYCLKDDLQEDECGTPNIFSPEMIKKQGYNTMTDWWAFGILLYKMIYNDHPFETPGCY